NRNKNKERAEKIGKVGNKIQVIVEDDSFPWSVSFNKVIHFFRKIEYHGNGNDQGNGEEKGAQEFFDDIDVEYSHLQTLLYLNQHLVFPLAKISFFDLCSGFFHQPKVKSQIVQTCYLCTQDFLGIYQVADICFGVGFVNKRIPILVQKAEILFPLFIAHVHDPIFGEKHSIAGIACGHHTIEHIYSQSDIFQNVGRGTHTH